MRPRSSSSSSLRTRRRVRASGRRDLLVTAKVSYVPHNTTRRKLRLIAMQIKADRSETNTSSEESIKKLQEESAKMASKK